MAEDKREPLTVTREAIASFATPDQFRDAVRRLLAAGFTPSDLSVLATHNSLEVAGYPAKPGEKFFWRASLTR